MASPKTTLHEREAEALPPVKKWVRHRHALPKSWAVEPVVGPMRRKLREERHVSGSINTRKPKSSTSVANGPSVREIVKRRWIDEHPFAGIGTPILIKKLQTGVLSADATQYVIMELRSRNYTRTAIRNLILAK